MGRIWADVDQVVGSGLNSSTNFRTLDVCDPNIWQKQRKFLQADLFTFIYFFSELYSQKDEAESFSTIYSMAPKRVHDFFSLIFGIPICRTGPMGDDGEKHGIEIIDFGERQFQVDYDEEKRDLADYFKKFDNPKITARISYRICQRE